MTEDGTYRDTTVVMQRLRDNLTLWNGDHEPDPDVENSQIF